ncbi:kinase-like domain-containing protein [Coprinopsis sp. MPI-PUGE-AT-0042]|nr:kinase-like domain-containing protein [Coprinopsis sp. MPI-PUGE-AT-0042]
MALASSSPAISTFERWLISLDNTLQLTVLWFLSPVDLVNLSATCFIIRRAIIGYQRSVWSVSSFLSFWFSNPVPFLIRMEGTGSVVSGSQAIRFFDRLPPNPRSDLDIFLRIAGLLPMGRFLALNGYEFSVNACPTPWGYFETSAFRIAGSRKFDRARQGYNILGVFDFIKAATASEQSLKVQLVVVNADPAEYIINSFHSTAVMNILTPHRAVSLFPNSTFLKRQSYICRKPLPYDERWLLKYTQRGFSLIREVDEIPQHLHVGLRHAADRFTWRIKQPDERAYIYPSLTTIDSPQHVPGTYLNGKYTVIKTIQGGSACEKVIARKVLEGGSVRIHIVEKAHYNPLQWLSELGYLRWAAEQPGIISLVDSFMTTDHYYLVFPSQVTTLGEIISAGEIWLPPTHIRDIIAQVLHALDHLHSANIRHGNISPAAVTFVSSGTTQIARYSTQTQTFDQQAILLSPEVKLTVDEVAVGNAGGTETYRAPEIIAGLPVNRKADVFAVGCMMAELILSRPFLCPCQGSPRYLRDSFLVMEKVIGFFPEEWAEEIENLFPGTFDDTNKVIEDDTIMESV